MSYEIRADYGQAYLLPPSIDDWLGADHPARFVGDFVDSLNLEALGFRVRESVEGRPSYASDLLLKVWLYGWMEGHRSARSQEKACLNHMGFIWLTGNQAPDHVTLWRFHTRHRQVLAKLFRQTVLMARSAGLVGMAVQALDGTKIQVASSSESSCKAGDAASALLAEIEALDSAIAELMDATEAQYGEGDPEYRLPENLQNAQERRQRIHELYEQLASMDPAQPVLPAEPEACRMKTRDGVRWAYNAQVVVDSHSQIIVAQDVCAQATDHGLLVAMIEEVVDALGESAGETVADAGYYSGKELEAAEASGYDVIVASPNDEKAKNDPYHVVHFDYDADKDCFICPQGKELPYMTTGPRGYNNEPKRVYRCVCFKECPVRTQCSNAKNGRTVVLDPHRDAVLRQRVKRNTDTSRALLGRRKVIVEPVFGWLKDRLGMRRWRVKGLEKIQAEWAMACTIVNLKKLHRHRIQSNPISPIYTYAYS